MTKFIESCNILELFLLNNVVRCENVVCPVTFVTNAIERLIGVNIFEKLRQLSSLPLRIQLTNFLKRICGFLW